MHGGIKQNVNLPTERISSTSHASSPVASSTALPSNGQPPAHMIVPTNMANGHRQPNVINPTGMYQNREASFGNIPPQQITNPLIFDNVGSLMPATSNQIMVADTSSQMFLGQPQQQQQQQQMDIMMGGNNKNLQPQEVMLNLMKEYGNPEQIGSLFDQQIADPFNIQMSLPLMDYFD